MILPDKRSPNENGQKSSPDTPEIQGCYAASPYLALREIQSEVTAGVVRLAVARDDFSIDAPIDQFMTRDVKTIWEDQGVFNATQYLRDYRVRRLPVIDRHDNLVAMLTADDLFGLFARGTFNVAHVLEPSLGSRI